MNRFFRTAVGSKYQLVVLGLARLIYRLTMVDFWGENEMLWLVMMGMTDYQSVEAGRVEVNLFRLRLVSI